MKLKNGQFEPPLKIFLFFKIKFIHFFLIPVDQKYQNESAPIFCYVKSTKKSLKLPNIADLQALTLGHVKKMTLYNTAMNLGES